MTQPAKIWDFVMPSVANQLDYNALVAAGISIPEFEANAYEDWCFDTGSVTGLTGRINSRVLTPNAAVPTYNAKTLTIPATGLNGLKTDLNDGLNQTLFGVFKRPADPTVLAMLFMDSTNSGAQGGAYVNFNTVGKVSATVRGYGAALTIAAAVGAVGTYQFVALSSKDTGSGNSEHTLFVGAPTPQTVTMAGIKTIATPQRPWAVGNAYTPTVDYDQRAVEVQGFGIIPASMTIAEMTALYKRKQIVALRRDGITVV